jgi:hypothetical protein
MEYRNTDNAKEQNKPSPSRSTGADETVTGSNTEFTEPGEFIVSSNFAKIHLRDYALLVGTLILVSTGIILIVTTGISLFNVTYLSFCGICLATSVNTIARKFGYRAFRATKVGVIGGVAIRARRARLFALGSIFFELGALLFMTPDPIELEVISISIFLMFVGTTLILGTIMRLWPSSFIQFDPNGLTIGCRNWRALIPWEAISSVGAKEIFENPFVCLSLKGQDSIGVQPASARAKAIKGLRGGIPGADVAIPTFVFGLDLPVLAAAIARYRSDPTARRELALRALSDKS